MPLPLHQLNVFTKSHKFNLILCAQNFLVDYSFLHKKHPTFGIHNMTNKFLLLILLTMTSINARVKLPSEDCYCLYSSRWDADILIKTCKIVGVFDGEPGSWSEKYDTRSIKSNLVKNPLYFYDYHNNLMIYNQAILMFKDYKIEALMRMENRLKRELPEDRKELQIKIESLKSFIDFNFQLSQQIRDRFKNCYINCHKKGHHLDAQFYDWSFIEFMEGNSADAAELAERYIAQNIDQIQNLNANSLSLLGQFHIDLRQFSEAIDLLSKAIEKEPSNKATYFQRATAYFETGDFDNALKDYLSSNQIEEMPRSVAETSVEFAQALMSSLGQASLETAIDLAPSLCSTVYGAGEVLWATLQDPINTSANFASICYELGQNAYESCKNIDWSNVEGYAYEFKVLCDDFMQLSEAEKGHLIGHIIGKYGTEIFAGAASYQGVVALRNLRKANSVYNFESMAVSSVNKEAIVQQSLKHANERETYLKNLKYNYDAHNKHLHNHNDYKDGNSIWEHHDPARLLKHFAGSGRPERGNLGVPGYKETVDFKEYIGVWINKEGTIKLPTTRGTIHYGNKGAHIVPADPNPQIGVKK